MNRQMDGLIAAFLCTAALGCADQSEPNVSRVAESTSEIRTTSDPEPIDSKVTPQQEPVEAQVVVYFGSFRDRLAAAKYREHLHSMGLLRVNIKTAKVGVEMLVTDPMDQAAAQELAESLGGRVLSLEWLHRTTRDYGLQPR